MVATGKTMTARSLAIIAAAFLAIALLAGCSTGASSGAPSSASSASAPSSASSASASSSASGSSYSAQADSASASASASASSESASASSDDFDRMIVGTWRVFSLEYGGYSKTKFGNEEIALLREMGLFENITLFADGTFRIDHGRSDIYEGEWVESGYNEIILRDSVDDDSLEDEDLTATIRSGRMTIEYDDPKYKHVKLVYSKQ